MDFKSGIMKMDSLKYSSKSPQIYEPVLKSKDNKPSNSNQTQSKNIPTKPNLMPSTKSQEEVDAYELAQAQKSLKLLKAKMSATPKQIFNPNRYENEENQNENFKNASKNNNYDYQSSANNQKNELSGANNQNYRKVFKPPINNKKDEEMPQPHKKVEDINYTKINQNPSSGAIGNNKDYKANSPISQPSKPLSSINKTSYNENPKSTGIANQNKPNPISSYSKSSLKGNPNLKASAEDYEYYDKNMRDYSKYSYNDNTNEVSNPISKKEDISQKKPFSPAIINKKSQESSNQQYNAYNKNKYYDEDEQNQNENDENEEDNDNNDENDEENQDLNDEENEDDNEENGNKNQDEYEEGGELVQCTMGCGRKFNANSIKKHMKICKKVFQSKRKVFDSSKTRTNGVVEKVKAGKGTNNSSKGNSQNKKNMWKKQSEAFRAMLKQSRNEPMTQQDRNVFEEAQNLVLCNWCGRKFNDSAAQKHIPFCEKKAKMDKMKQQSFKRK